MSPLEGRHPGLIAPLHLCLPPPPFSASVSIHSILFSLWTQLVNILSDIATDDMDKVSHVTVSLASSGGPTMTVTILQADVSSTVPFMQQSSERLLMIIGVSHILSMYSCVHTYVCEYLCVGACLWVVVYRCLFVGACVWVLVCGCLCVGACV